MRDTVVIMGSHPRTRPEFDWGRDDCDVWVFNEALSAKFNSNGVDNKWVGRCDAVFQMHEPVIWKNPHNRNDPKHYQWLQRDDIPTVYMQEHYPEIPRSVRFPLDEIRQRFGLNYFTSSVSYAIGLACLQGYKRIEVYGVEMETNTEYQYQRDGVTLWLGVAVGLGIAVDLHMGMLDAPLYGYEGEVVLPEDTFAKAIEALQPEIEAARADYGAKFLEAKRELEAMLSTDNSKAVGEAVHTLAQAATRWGIADGMRQENMKYQAKAEAMKREAGKFLFSRQEFETSMQKLGKQFDELVTQTNHAGGEASAAQKALLLAAKGSPKRQKLLHEFMAAIQKYLDAQRAASTYQGGAQCNANYCRILDARIRAAGGAKSEQVMLEAMANA